MLRSQGGGPTRSLRPRLEYLIATGGLLALALAFGFRRREDRDLCPPCRALRVVQSTSFLSSALWSHEEIALQGEVPPSHVHDWSRYSYAYSNGFMGCLGKGVGCHPEGPYRALK